MASASDRFSDSKVPARLTRRGLVLGAFGLIAGAVAPAAAQPVIVSSPRFVLEVNGTQIAIFPKLVGISSNVEPPEYIYENPNGSINHIKQFGKLRPPTVMLQGPGLNKTLWKWHQAVRLGEPGARQDAALLIEDASTKQVIFSYELVKAWPSKIELGSAKAGSSNVVWETVTFVCEEIIVQATP